MTGHIKVEMLTFLSDGVSIEVVGVVVDENKQGLTVASFWTDGSPGARWFKRDDLVERKDIPLKPPSFNRVPIMNKDVKTGDLKVEVFQFKYGESINTVVGVVVAEEDDGLYIAPQFIESEPCGEWFRKDRLVKREDFHPRFPAAVYVPSPLTFQKVSRINLERSETWHKGSIYEWSVSDWGVAMAGEAGEVCDAIKKLNRLQGSTASANNPASEKEAIQKIATEIGDTYLYLDLLAQRLGLRMEDCVRDTFNRVSKRENLPFILQKESE